MANILYIRVSTNEQHLGVEAQRTAATAFLGQPADREYLAMGISGGAPLEERLVLLDAITSLSPGDTLVVAKRDRLARDTLIAALLEKQVEKAGASIQSANGVGNDNTPEALLMRRMVDAFSEYERALIKARTKAALAVAASRGHFPGPPGAGTVKEGRRSVASPLGLRCVALRASGASLRSIADQVGLRHAAQVSRILARVERLEAL
jgi:DNA invertase Pin-like site-specific DNA recombinase